MAHRKQQSRSSSASGHIRVGTQYKDITQLLLYSFGLQDQEFVVVYETDDLRRFLALVQELVGAIRQIRAEYVVEPGKAIAVRFAAEGARVLVSDINRQTAEAIGRAAGVDEVVAEVLPGDKARIQQMLGREDARQLTKMVVVLFQLLELDTTEENFEDVAEADGEYDVDVHNPSDAQARLVEVVIDSSELPTRIKCLSADFPSK